MTTDKDKILKQLQEVAKNAKPTEYPSILNDERLEDAFKEPIADENGCCESIPAIWNDYGYGKYDDRVLFITLKSATIKSNLYSKYLDERALVWDSVNERLLLYLTDPKEPRMAFKGSRWQFAKRLKSEYYNCSLIYIYQEFLQQK